jgi:hypothetical protein
MCMGVRFEVCSVMTVKTVAFCDALYFGITAKCHCSSFILHSVTSHNTAVLTVSNYS